MQTKSPYDLPSPISTTSLTMVGVKECSMEDEDFSQATMSNFQEVKIW